MKTRVPHASEQIACEGLVHTSLNHVWESSRVSLREEQIEPQLDSSQHSTCIDHT